MSGWCIRVLLMGGLEGEWGGGWWVVGVLMMMCHWYGCGVGVDGLAVEGGHIVVVSIRSHGLRRVHA